MSVSRSLPAILGGEPVRPEGPPAWPAADPEITAALARSVQTGDWGRYDGPASRELVRRLGEEHGTEHVVLCSSGTVAVELALRGLKIGDGDEVLLAGYDFRGNFLNVTTVGATPVLVDIDPATGQLDHRRVVDALSPKTRAIVASHLHGGVVDLGALRRIADTHGLVLIEDACQTPLAPLEEGGGIAGTRGDVGVVSFGGSKLLSAGRGGALVTNRGDVAARLRRHTFRGNEAYPLSELQATVLLPQLDRLAERRSERRRRAAELFAALRETPPLEPITTSLPGSEPDFYKIPFRYRAAACEGLPRAVFAAALRAEGFALFAGFRALHGLHARSRFRSAGALTEATRADADWLVLHHPLLLEGAAGIAGFVEAVTKVLRSAERLQAAGLSGEAPVSPWPQSLPEAEC